MPYDETECTCDLMAHPCEIHDTSGSPDVVRGPRKAQLPQKLVKWFRGLEHGGCLACPEDCVSCPGNRQDCECYEHQEDGPTDDQLRDMLGQVENRINELMPEIKKTLNAWNSGPDDDSEECTHEIMHMGTCAGCGAKWDGDGWELPSLSTKMRDMELTTTDKPFIKYAGRTYTAEGVTNDETGEFTPSDVVPVPVKGGFPADRMLIDDPGSVDYPGDPECHDYRSETDPCFNACRPGKCVANMGTGVI